MSSLVQPRQATTLIKSVESCTINPSKKPDSSQNGCPAWALAFSVKADLSQRSKKLASSQCPQLAPDLQKEEVVKDSKKQDPQITEVWTGDAFNSTDWQAGQPLFKALSPGRKTQISKHAHEWTPAMHKRAQISSKINQQCFACGTSRRA